MKRIANIIIAFVAIVFVSAGAASAASEYTVKKGDTLWKIGRQFQISWKVLQRESGIKNPHKIYPGQKIVIPDNFYWENANANPFKGTLSEALLLNEFPTEAAVALEREISESRYEEVMIKDGDYIKSMTFGKNEVKKNVIARTGKNQPARLYKAIIGNTQYRLVYPKACGNWSRFKDMAKPEEPPAPPPPSKVSEPTPEVMPPLEPPLLQLAPRRQPLKLFRSEELRCVDVELNIRQGFWWGEKASGEFSYAEGGVWDSCWYWGRMVGFYANRDSGKVSSSSYEWDSWGIGPQVGLRYLDFYKRDDGTVGFHGWTAKLRLAYASVSGKNPHSLYHMTQQDLLLGLYMEYVRQISQETTVALTFEAWFSLWNKIDSSWSGDKASNRGWIQAGGYVQKKISDDWAVRVGAYGFYHLWDEETGIGGFAEARYDNWLLAGAYANFGFENGLAKGVYIGAEPGTLYSRKMNQEIDDSIWAVDEKGNPLEGGKKKKTDKEMTNDDEFEDIFIFHPKSQVNLSYSPSEI